jgi:transposase
MKNIRRTFSKEFKEEAAKLVTEQGYTVPFAAKQLGVHERNIDRWVYELKSGKKAQQKKAIDFESAEETKKLKKENARLKMENEILKKAAAFFATATVKNMHL